MVNNGTVGSGVSFAPGEVGQAFDFSAGNSGVKIPGNASLHIGQFDQHYSLSFGIDAWIKPADISTPHPIIQWNDGSGLALWISVSSPGSLYVTFGQGGNSFSSPPGLIDTNSFHHVAVAYGGYAESAECFLYVDGVLVATNSFVEQAATSGEVTLGFSPPGSSYVGLVDEVGVYNFFLDDGASYFQSIYNAGSAGRCHSVPDIVTSPGDQSVLAGTNVTLTVNVASSQFPWGYQWQFKGTNIQGANTNPLVLQNVQPANTGAYTVVVTNAFGSVTSAPANLMIVITAVSVATQPASQTATTGNDATFTVVAGGSGPYSYQWLFQGTNIAGATGSSFTVNAQAATSGTYAVLVSNPANSVLSSNATLSLQAAVCYPPPSGLVAWWPGDGDARDNIGGNDGVLRGAAGFGPGKVGQDFTFASSGYVNVPDETNWSFGTNDFSIELWASFSSVQTDNFFVAHDESASGGTNRWSFGLNSGSLQFQTSSASGISSSPFAPIIGNYYHLAVTHTGGIYTFYVNGVPMGSVTNSTPVPVAHAPLAFAQSGGLGYLNGQLDEIAIYNRALSPSEILGIYTAGSAGKCETAAAPVITTQPANQTVTAGATVTLTAQIASPQPLVCQWYFNYAPVTGATNLSLTLYSVSTNQAGLYQLVASNALSSVASRLAQLTVLPNTNVLPVIIVQPQSRMYMACDPATLSVTATGNGPFSYQWYLNGTTPVGGNSPTLTLPAISPTCAGTYTVEVSNGAGSVTSSNAVVSIVPGSLLYFNNFSGGGLTGPFPGDPNGPGTASDSSAPSPPIVALVGNNLDYGYLGLGGTGPVNIGFNTSSGGSVGFWGLLPPAEIFESVTAYCGTNGASAFPLEGTAFASISAENYAGQPFPAWTYVSSDIPPAGRSPGYTWFGWEYEINYPNNPNETCEIDDVTISSFLPPLILAPLQDQSALTGETVAFNIVAVGDHSMKYQWQLDGTNLPGATTSTLTLNSVTTNQSGAYGVLVGNSLGSVQSAAATLTVNPNPVVIDAQPQAETTTYGSNATFSVLAEGAGPLTYQWQFDGVSISGATNTSLTLDDFQSSEAGSYDVIISNSFGSVTSAVATVNPPSSSSYTLAVSASGSTLNLSWPGTASGFILESCTSLKPPASWVPVTNVPVADGPNYMVSVPMSGSAGYYRLRKGSLGQTVHKERVRTFRPFR